MTDKIKTAFFLLGNSYIGTKAFIKCVGLEPVPLHTPSKKTISDGVLYAPEFACFPFKVSLGMLIQALDSGAQLYIIPAGRSQNACQLADFGRVQQYIMQKTGRQFEILELDSLQPQKLIEKFRKYNPKLTMKEMAHGILLGRQKILLLETVEECYRNIYLAESKKNAEEFRRKWEHKIDESHALTELYVIGMNLNKEFATHKKLNPDNLVRVAVVGDIYCLNDATVNNNIYERLLSMGVYVEQNIKYSNVIGNPLDISFNDMMLERKAEKYLKHNVAAHAKDTIKDTIRYAQSGFDGVIQIFPFNCMPEITARNILPKVGRDHGIPILHLPMDEQTGDAGFTTRIEAFVDLLRIRKRRSK